MIKNYKNLATAVHDLGRSYRFIEGQYDYDRDELKAFLKRIYNSRQIHDFGLVQTKAILCDELLKPKNKRILITALDRLVNYSNSPIFIIRYQQANGNIIDLTDISILMNIPCKRSFLAEANDLFSNAN